MAIAFVQDAYAEVGGGGAGSLSVTLTVTAAHGAVIGVLGANGITQTMSDSGAGAGNTFTTWPSLSFPVDNTSPSARYTCFFVKNLVGGSTTFKVTFGSNSTFSSFNVVEISGQDNTTFTDTGSRGHGNGSGDLSSGNFTTAKASEFIYCFGNKNASGGLTQGTGMTILRTASATGFGSAYKISGGAGSTSALLNNGSAVDYDVFGVAILPTAVATSDPPFSSDTSLPHGYLPQIVSQ